MTGSDAEQFSLRWNNFHSNLSSGFHTLLQEVELVDVTLAADGQFLQAHKIVLSICSPYFKQLFRANPCKHPIVILKDVSYKELVAILQFMYQGEVNVRQEELAEFLKTAEMLQIKGLTGSESDQEAEGSSPSSLPHLPPPAPPRPRSQVCLQESRLQSRLQGVSQVYKSRNETEKLTPLLRDEGSSAPPVKRMKSDVSPTTAQLAQVEGQTKTEFDARTPKIEPVDLDSDPEEDNEHIQHNSLSILDINSGESSQSHDISLAPTGNMDSSPGVLQDTSQDTNQGLLQFIASSQGRAQLVYNGYIYNADRKNDDKVFWRCAKYQRGCRCRCITVNNEVISVQSEHNHYACHDQIVRKTFYQVYCQNDSKISQQNRNFQFNSST